MEEVCGLAVATLKTTSAWMCWILILGRRTKALISTIGFSLYGLNHRGTLFFPITSYIGFFILFSSFSLCIFYSVMYLIYLWFKPLLSNGVIPRNNCFLHNKLSDPPILKKKASNICINERQYLHCILWITMHVCIHCFIWSLPLWSRQQQGILCLVYGLASGSCGGLRDLPNVTSWCQTLGKFSHACPNTLCIV